LDGRLPSSEREERKRIYRPRRESSDDEEKDKSYRRHQRGYLAWRAAIEEENDSDYQSGDENEEEVSANLSLACRGSNEAFPSGNKLHSYLKLFNAHAVDTTPKVIDLTAHLKGDHPEGIIDYTETGVTAFRSTDIVDTFCAIIDSGFGCSAVNRKLLATVPHSIKSVKQLIICGIEGRQSVNELAIFVFYLRGVQGRFLKLKIAALIFNDLGANLLVGTDYSRAWNLTLDLPRQLGIFHRDNKAGKPLAVIHLRVSRQPNASVVTRAAVNCTIPANAIGQIPLRGNFSIKADLLRT
jgi:hypothetical protein